MLAFGGLAGVGEAGDGDALADLAGFGLYCYTCNKKYNTVVLPSLCVEPADFQQICLCYLTISLTFR